MSPVLRWLAGITNDLSAWLPWFANAAFNGALRLAPLIILVAFFRYPPSTIGLNRLPVKLILVLLLGTWVIGQLGDDPTEPVSTWPLWFALHLLINAGHEELLHRGWIIPRLRALGLRPFDAIGLSAFLFGASHIPSALLQPDTDSLGHLTLIYPSGIVWGYLWIRTRSLWACIIWHASILVVGNLFNPFI